MWLVFSPPALMSSPFFASGCLWVPLGTPGNAEAGPGSGNAGCPPQHLSTPALACLWHPSLCTATCTCHLGHMAHTPFPSSSRGPAAGNSGLHHVPGPASSLGPPSRLCSVPLRSPRPGLRPRPGQGRVGSWGRPVCWHSPHRLPAHCLCPGLPGPTLPMAGSAHKPDTSSWPGRHPEEAPGSGGETAGLCSCRPCLFSQHNPR